MKGRKSPTYALKELKWIQHKAYEAQSHMSTHEEDSSGRVAEARERGFIIFGDKVLVYDGWEHPRDCECVERGIEEDPWPLEGRGFNWLICFCAAGRQHHVVLIKAGMEVGSRSVSRAGWPMMVFDIYLLRGQVVPSLKSEVEGVAGSKNNQQNGAKRSIKRHCWRRYQFAYICINSSCEVHEFSDIRWHHKIVMVFPPKSFFDDTRCRLRLWWRCYPTPP